MHALLQHVMALEACTDPDCEIHNPEVGVEEETVTEVQLAFYIAGARVLSDMIAEVEGELDCDEAVTHAYADLMVKLFPHP